MSFAAFAGLVGSLLVASIPWIPLDGPEPSPYLVGTVWAYGDRDPTTGQCQIESFDLGLSDDISMFIPRDVVLEFRDACALTVAGVSQEGVPPVSTCAGTLVPGNPKSIHIRNLPPLDLSQHPDFDPELGTIRVDAPDAPVLRSAP